MTAVKAPCAANALEPDTGDRMYPTPNRGHRLGNSLRGSRRDSADFHEYPRGVQRLVQSTSLENDVEQCGVVTDSGNDDIGARDHTANFGFALKVCAGGAFTSFRIAR
jgi:hypothetical protein